MARFRLWWYALIVAVAIMGSAWIYLTRMPPEPGDALNQAAHVNFRAPPLALPLLSGGKATLGDLRGQVVLVNFWATWCVPCRTEMPEIQAAYQAHRGEGFTVLAIDAQEDDASVAAFVEQFHLTFPVLLDHDGAAMRQYQVQALPTSFLIDRAGVVRWSSLGGMTHTSIEAQLATLRENGR